MKATCIGVKGENFGKKGNALHCVHSPELEDLDRKEREHIDPLQRVIEDLVSHKPRTLNATRKTEISRGGR